MADQVLQRTGIRQIRQRLEQIVPEAVYAIGHGQMPERELELIKEQQYVARGHQDPGRELADQAGQADQELGEKLQAMDAIKELQSPVTITLSLKDIRACFRCCLWDEGLQRMVSYREFARASAAA